MKERVNLKAETRNDYYIDEKMKKVWNVELDLLSKLLEVCEKYNLKCYADAGTLLGAVRHKGFIPWDDDLDVAMFREDYDKLLQIAEKEFKNPYFLQTAYTDENYIRGHAQLRNSNTTAILKGEKELGYDIAKWNKGIFIDIFALDGVTNDPKKLEKQKRKVMFRKRLLTRYILKGKGETFKTKLAYAISSIMFKIIPYRKYYAKIEDIFRNETVENNEMVAPLNFIFETTKRMRKKSLYNDTVMLDFENIKIPAPAGYDEFLKQRYGDYMKPNKVSTTHGEVFFDPDKSYKNYM